jgi:hypothetical protein
LTFKLDELIIGIESAELKKFLGHFLKLLEFFEVFFGLLYSVSEFGETCNKAFFSEYNHSGADPFERQQFFRGKK